MKFDNLLFRIIMTFILGSFYLTGIIVIITGFDILFKSIIWETLWDLFFSSPDQNPLQRVGIILIITFLCGLLAPLIFKKLPSAFHED